jgi:DNA polymerase-3 subunit beta
MRAVDNRFHIRAGATEFELNTLPAEDFPQMHAPTEAVTSFSVPSAALADAMQFCSPAMGVNDIRYYINSMHLAVSSAQVTLCATDGHRLHRARFPIEEGPEKAASGIIPRDAIPSILQIASRHTNVELQLSSTHLGVVDRETLGIRLMETTFPDTQRVIPTGRTVTGSAPRKTFADAIARLSNVFMGEEKHPGMRFRFTKDGILIHAQNVADERGKTTVQWEQADNKLVDTELGLRWDFLTDALKAFSGDTVFVHLGRTDEALYLTDDNEGRHEAVVMPMRI